MAAARAGVTADGQIGAVTLAALEGRVVADLIDEVCDRRLAMLRTLRTFRTFGAGWMRRVAEVRMIALAMATGGAAPPPPNGASDPAPAKARPDDVRLSRTPEGAGGMLSGAGALGAVVTEQAQALAPLAELAPVRWLFAALMVAGVMLTLHGALARIRAGEASA